LILDHHEVDNGYSNNAVVINNQLSKSYPTKSLCGGGVVYKFCCYFDKIMGTNYAIEFEDLAALAEISDMMNIRDFETHYIIKAGLQRIQNPFFV
jgi:single-stranded-DNA-specific exonuclease